MHYINIHSHKPANSSVEIINLIAGIDNINSITPNHLYSLGIHPWYTEKLDNKKDILINLSKQPNIIAIGECGFDPKSQLPFADQEQLFIFQAQIADILNKPLIIHCVKAINELIRLKKTLKPAIPWVIHGFNANEQELNECIKHGFLISIGHQLMHPGSSISKIISQVPLSSLFFETDESEISIAEIYSQYSELTGKPIDEVDKTIYANFARYFLKKPIE